MVRTHRFFCRSVLLCLAGLLVFAEAVDAQVRFRIRPYLGIGVKYTAGFNLPDFQREDTADSSYYNLHLTSPSPFYLHFHGRVMFLELWDFSIGYQLWTHYHKYTDDLTELWLKIGRVYPHSYYFTMHGIAVQYTVKFAPVSTPLARPFVAGGIGRYNGATKKVHYEETYENSGILMMVTEPDQKFEGWGFFFGAGVTLFRYAFVYLEYTDLYRRSLRSSQFIQFSVGFTL